MRTTTMRVFILLSITVLFVLPNVVTAAPLKGKLTVKSGVLDADDFSLLAQAKNGKIRSARIGANGKFSINGATLTDRISVLYRSNFYSPLVLAVARGKTIKTFKAARNSSLCSSSTARVILAAKKKFDGALNIEIDSNLEVAYAKKVAAEQSKNIRQGASGAAATSCLPQGLVESVAQSVARGSNVSPLAENDADDDGIPNESDVDDDDDGLTDVFDGDNDGDGVIDDADVDNNDSTAANQLFYFQQLHLDRADSFHPKLQTVTPAMIDNALVLYGGLALEVKTGSSVELNCGGDADSGALGLPWCTAGGTGRSREPFPSGLEFPEGSDADGDGKGEMTAGSSGDMQLAPGATSAQIQPGDTFVEEVTDEDNVVTQYVGVLNSVVHTVPGVVSITTSVGTYTLDYPASASAVGTYSNPVLVPSTGDVNATITVFPPLYNTVNGLIVPGVLTFITQIPNGPCTYDSGSGQCSGGGSGPGLIPGSLYSNPSTGWTLSSDGVKSNTTDKTVDESESATYTVNLTGTGGVTGWDAGEYLKVPIQALDQNGTTSAHNVIFRRQP